MLAPTSQACWWHLIAIVWCCIMPRKPFVRRRMAPGFCQARRRSWRRRSPDKAAAAASSPGCSSLSGTTVLKSPLMSSFQDF